MMNIFWPMIVAILVATIYAVIVHWKAPSEAWDWWHSLIAMLVSILLGVTIALSLFQNQQQAIAKTDKQRFLSLLRLELSGIRRGLRDPTRANLWVHSGVSLPAQVTYIQPLILEEAGRSGLFDNNTSFMMIDLSGSMRMFNKKTQILLDLLSSSKEPVGLEENVRAAITNIDRSRGGILKGIGLLSADLGIELTDKKEIGVRS